MDIKLLKQLLPGEVNEFYIRNDIRADGRDPKHHRKYFIAREVLYSRTEQQQLDQQPTQSKFSTSVKLGNTHVLCSMTVSQ